MAVGDEANNADNIQAQVLRTTLAEVSATRRDAANATNVGHDRDRDRDRDDGEEDEGEDSAVAVAVAVADPDCCVICLDAISGPCTAYPCAHAHFDFLCLVSWLQQRPNCPLCQSAVYKVIYPQASVGDGTHATYRVPNAPRRRPSTEAADHVPRRQWRGDADAAIRPQNDRRARHHPQDPMNAPTPEDAIQCRRHVYRHQLYSLHIGSNRVSRYKPPPTPAEFAAAPHLVARARLWIRRELRVFAFLSDVPSGTEATGDNSAGSSGSGGARTTDDERQQMRRRNNAEFLLEYIVAILKTVDIQGSIGQAEDMLADFLGRDHARLFLHELRSWLRSPAQSLVAWDREVQYPDPNRKRILDGSESQQGQQAGVGLGARGNAQREGYHDHRRPGSAQKRRYEDFAVEPGVDQGAVASRNRSRGRRQANR